MSPDEIHVGSRKIELSNRRKVLFPEDEITKGNVVDYYRRVAGTMLLHMKDRPLNMQRFPNGIEQEGFYQKKVPDYFPEWIDSTPVYLKAEKKRQHQVVCNHEATLVYLAEKACVTPHLWLSLRDNLERPDRLVFDLDPPGGDFNHVRKGAQVLKDMLLEVDLKPYLMTTGSRGLHVVVPLDRNADFETVRSFARDVADQLAQENPDRYTTETRKDRRKGRIFIDYLRNAYAQTAAAPYSIRPKPGAPVATPLEWQELYDSRLHAGRYTIRNIFRRLGQKEDPWKHIDRHGRSVEKAHHMLKKLSQDRSGRFSGQRKRT
jgi:bifunctional non-homologous end joining protein LigD